MCDASKFVKKYEYIEILRPIKFQQMSKILKLDAAISVPGLSQECISLNNDGHESPCLPP